VRFLKGKLRSFDSPYVFRNDAIGAKRISRSSARRAFKKTKVFVIEIASRWEYLHKGNYIHHVAFDSPEMLPMRIRDSGALSEIVRRKQSFEELEEVLNLLVEELTGKALVFVTNISTRDGSERDELNRFISDFAKQRGLGFYDPSELLARHRLEDICKIEPVISHYTSLGHELVGSKLNVKILEQLAQSLRVEVDLTQTYEDGDGPEEIHGLGDFIFGCLTVFEHATQNKLIPRVNTSNHPIGGHLKKGVECKQKIESPVVRSYHGESNKLFRDAGPVFTNKRPKIAPSAAALDWLKTEALPLGQDVISSAQESLRTLGLKEKGFLGIHVRLGDQGLMEKGTDRELVHKAFKLVSRISSNFLPLSDVLLFSDSGPLIEMCSRTSIKVLPSKPVHLGKRGNGPREVESTLVEFLLLSKARHIVQISTYAWGSGFSEAAGIFGGVGLSRVAIRNH
jgi:hypothetical protein